MTGPDDPSRKTPPVPPSFPEDPELDEHEDEDEGEPDELIVAAAVALADEVDEDEDEDEDLALPPQEGQDDKVTWEPVDDLAEADMPEPSTIASAVVEDPWQGVADAGAKDLSFDPSGTDEPPEDPWGPLGMGSDDLPSPSELPVLPAPAASTLLLPVSNPRRSTPAPRSIPWRLPADVVEPVAGRIVVMAAPRLEQSRLLVAHWEWVDEQQEHVRLRLADDGADTVNRVAHLGQPVVRLRLRLAGVDVVVDVTLATDRSERGLLLGRDVLADRFLVDASREDWP